ncbi:MAG: CDP-alcohol phosphatidyltransferase family protein [Aquificae bacterium]|nr:CDP-alcohol phosphatidyltransferase family protein [Aquificota bacterium]
MSSLTKSLKPHFEQITLPIINFFAKLGISPNFLTVSGLVFTLFSVPFLAQGAFVEGGILVLLGALCDSLDGPLARKTNRVSKFGALLDSTIDRISDFLPLFGLALYFAEHLIWLSITLLNIAFWFLVSYVKARLEGLGVKKPIGGLFERTERVVVLITALFLNLVQWGLLITLIGSFFTFLQRLYLGYKYLSRE